MERYGVSPRIQSECGKMPTEITPNADTFYAALILKLHQKKAATLKKDDFYKQIQSWKCTRDEK